MTKLRSYFQPDSLTWWSGVALIAMGALNILKPETEAYGQVLTALTGTGDYMPPAMMIAFGTGLIGKAGKLKRMEAQRE